MRSQVTYETAWLFCPVGDVDFGIFGGRIFAGEEDPNTALRPDQSKTEREPIGGRERGPRHGFVERAFLDRLSSGVHDANVGSSERADHRSQKRRSLLERLD